MVFPRHLPEIYYSLPDTEVDLSGVQSEIEGLRTLVNKSSAGVGVYDINANGDVVQSIMFGAGFSLDTSSGEAEVSTYNLDYVGDNTIESVDDSTSITFLGADISRNSNGVVVDTRKSSPSRAGELFYSLIKDNNPDKLYQGETYNVADYQDFLGVINSSASEDVNNIVKVNRDTFTIDGLTDFVRGTANEVLVGRLIEDTTAVNGLQVNNAQNPAIFWNQVTANGGSTLYGNQVNAQTPSHSHSLTGDAETAPKHTLLFVGIYAR